MIIGDLDAFLMDLTPEARTALEKASETPLTLELARQNIGRKVVYWFYGPLGRRGEGGVIHSVNDAFVFVRYGQDPQPKATRPEDLCWDDPASCVAFLRRRPVLGNQGEPPAPDEEPTRPPSARDQARLAKIAAALALPDPESRPALAAQIHQLHEALRAAQSLDDLGPEANAKANIDMDLLFKMLREREGK